MNNESQNIEYKLIKQNEFHKMVYGFANAQGGTIYIDTDDESYIKRISNIHKLSEETLYQKFNRKIFKLYYYDNQL